MQVHSSRSFTAACREVTALFGADDKAGGVGDGAADAAADAASGASLATASHAVPAGVTFVRGGGERGAGSPGVVPAPGTLLAVGSLNETICCILHPRLLQGGGGGGGDDDGDGYGATASGFGKLKRRLPGLARLSCSGTAGGTADLSTVFEAFARHGFVPVALRQVALTPAQAAAFATLGTADGRGGSSRGVAPGAAGAAAVAASDGAGARRAAALCEGGGACVAVALQRDSAVARAAAMLGVGIGGGGTAAPTARKYSGASAFGSSGGAAPIEPSLAACMSVSKSSSVARLELCWFFAALHSSVDAIRVTEHADDDDDATPAVSLE